MLAKWETINKKHIYDFRIFDAYIKTAHHPKWKKDADYVVIDSPDWVNIVPVTKDNKIVMVKQFRHGIEDFTLEIPGGLIEKDEDPKVAGMRECMEETGWGSDSDAIYIGKTHPNPAFMNNTCYSYLWEGCYEKTTQELDGNEDIEVVLLDSAELKNYINEFKIKNSLVMNGIFFYMLNYGNL
jgi:ADP-ribose pyrophosphatase